MRKQTKEDLRIIREQKDLLIGCINRMSVTDNLDELWSMLDSACNCISRVFGVNYSRLTDSEEGGVNA